MVTSVLICVRCLASAHGWCPFERVVATCVQVERWKSLVRMARLYPWCAWRALYQVVRLRALCAHRAPCINWCACAPCIIGVPGAPCISSGACAPCVRTGVLARLVLLVGRLGHVSVGAVARRVYTYCCAYVSIGVPGALCISWCACVLCIKSWRAEGAITLNEGDFGLCWITITNSLS